MPTPRAEHHLVTVWNPSYAADAMEQHLGLLLHLAGEYDKGAIGDEQLYVWWGKVRSPNRQGPQANADDIRRIAKELDAGERDEVQLYLTDYQSLYVGDVDVIREGDRATASPRTCQRTTPRNGWPSTSRSVFVTSGVSSRATCLR